jgi:hypothetical protein
VVPVPAVAATLDDTADSPVVVCGCVPATVTSRAEADSAVVWVFSYLADGWVAFDDLSVVAVGTSTNLVSNPK